MRAMATTVLLLALGCGEDSVLGGGGKPPPTNVPSAVPSANISMGSLEVNGLAAKGLSCQWAGNPFAMMGILEPVAKQKSTLDGCVEKPTQVSVHVAVSAKKAGDVRVQGAPTDKAAICIAKAITEAPWGDDLTCVFSIDVGK